MLKKLYLLLMLISILFIFSGCEEFFTFNLFDGLDYVAVPTAQKLNDNPPEESVAMLAEQMESDSFMETVANDPETVIVISDYLETVYSDPTVAEETRVSAAVLDADLNLAVTGGDEFVNNVFEAIQQLQTIFATEPTGTEDPAEQISTLLTALVPAAILAETDPVLQAEAFEALIADILEAGAIYATLGNDIITDPTQGTDVYGDITGGVVMNAFVCGLITETIDTLFLPAYQEPAAAAGILLDMLQAAQTNTLSELDLSLVIDTNASIENLFTDLTYLENIALAAGADLTALLGQTTVPVAP